MACDVVSSIHSSRGSIQVVVEGRSQRWRGGGLAGRLLKVLGRQGKELCRQRHITGRGPGKCQNKMCWLRLEMKIHSWLPQANLCTSQRPAQAEGLVTESDIQHRGQHPPLFQCSQLQAQGPAPQQTQGMALFCSPNSASCSTRRTVRPGTLTQMEDLF